MYQNVNDVCKLVAIYRQTTRTLAKWNNYQSVNTFLQGTVSCFYTACKHAHWTLFDSFLRPCATVIRI